MRQSNYQVRAQTGQIFVDKPDVLEDLINDPEIRYPTNRSRQSHSVSRQSIDSIGSRPISPKECFAKLLKEQKLKEAKQTDILLKQNIQKTIDDAFESKEKAFPILLANVDKATDFLSTIDKDLNLIEETKKNKTRRQFDDWNSNVHGVIQRKIADSVNKIDSKSLNKSKNNDFDKFLSITNRKPAIFNDIIIESDYDPLEPNRRCLKTMTGKIKDPVKIDAQKAESESNMLGLKRNKVKLGKYTLPVEQWASGKIEATPYGSFAKMMNTDGDDERSLATETSKIRNKTMASNVAFDHFAYASGKAAVDSEMPRGKRVYPKTIHANPANAYK